MLVNALPAVNPFHMVELDNGLDDEEIKTFMDHIHKTFFSIQSHECGK
jgi:hypothetical protein